MKSIYFYKIVISLFLLFTSCTIEDENADEFLSHPIRYVFHDALEEVVEDTLTQLAIDVKIVGWKKTERDEYLLHYKFTPKTGEGEEVLGIVPYTKINIKEDVLTESLFFSDLDSATEYTLELSSSYEDTFTSKDTYIFSTKGDTVTIVNEEEEME